MTRNELADKGSNFIFVLFQLCGCDTPYVAPHELKKRHAEAREASLAIFHGICKMGKSESFFSEEYLDSLEKEISEAFENFVKRNDGKNKFNSVVFFAVAGLGFCVACVAGVAYVFASVRPRSRSCYPSGPCCGSKALAGPVLFPSLICQRPIQSNANPEEDVD